jgi:hypothetical protein
MLEQIPAEFMSNAKLQFEEEKSFCAVNLQRKTKIFTYSLLNLKRLDKRIKTVRVKSLIRLFFSTKFNSRENCLTNFFMILNYM